MQVYLKTNKKKKKNKYKYKERSKLYFVEIMCGRLSQDVYTVKSKKQSQGSNQ